MNKEEQSNSTDQESLDETKANKSNAIMNAALIGIMFGVVLWIVAKNNVGFFTLIPLYFIYKLANKPKSD